MSASPKPDRTELKERLLDIFNEGRIISGSALRRELCCFDTEYLFGVVRELELEGRIAVSGARRGPNFAFCTMAMLPSQREAYQNEQRLKISFRRYLSPKF